MEKNVFKTVIGNILIEEENGYITKCTITNEETQDCTSSLLKLAQKEMNEYLCGERKEFDLPLKIDGTVFQKRCYEALLKIPYGKTISYKEEAEMIGSPKAARAVGGANNKNRIMIFIPCHRVIGKDGSLVGFGASIKVKEFLLNLEKEHA